ncbi:MAG TPA: efflux RND transporter periplasmic adaptor subunit [Gemmatimonadaceae bacterium]|nr:efflux RND transporter periplasmic adaptor subunit [Gemmatimonadaceae bacterium]
MHISQTLASRRPTAARLLTGALAMAALSACKGGADGDARAATTDSTGGAAAGAPVSIGAENIAIVGRDTIRTGPAISGSLAPEKEATVRAEVPGAVLQTFVDAGQRVSAGSVLARIDDTAIRDAFLSARSAVVSAENSADVARRDLERSEKLIAAGAIAERDVEQARRGNTGAQAQLAAAKAQLASAEKQLEKTRVRAPFTGIVSNRQVNAGDVVSPGGEMFTIVEPSSMRLEGSVPAEQLAEVRVGVPVRFTVSGYPGRTFQGRITRVNPIADPATRQVRIIASIPNAGSTLVGGLFAEGRVAAESREAAVVPMSAVDERGLSPSAVRVKNGKVERVTLQLGLRDPATESVEVTSGLAAGDTVLLGTAAGLSPGTPVRVSAPPSDRAPGGKVAEKQ